MPRYTSHVTIPKPLTRPAMHAYTPLVILLVQALCALVHSYAALFYIYKDF